MVKKLAEYLIYYGKGLSVYLIKYANIVLNSLPQIISALKLAFRLYQFDGYFPGNRKKGKILFFFISCL